MSVNKAHLLSNSNDFHYWYQMERLIYIVLLSINCLIYFFHGQWDLEKLLCCCISLSLIKKRYVTDSFKSLKQTVTRKLLYWKPHEYFRLFKGWHLLNCCCMPEHESTSILCVFLDTFLFCLSFLTETNL